MSPQRFPMLWCLLAALAVGTLAGCASEDPVAQHAKRVGDLEERMERLEQQVARLQDKLNAPVKEATPNQTEDLDAPEKLNRIVTRKLGTQARSYQTNGSILIINTANGAKAGFDFEPPDQFKVQDKAMKLPDLSHCTAPKKGKTPVYPDELDVVVSPDNSLGWVVFPCESGGERLFLLDVQKATVLDDESTGELTRVSAVLWSPDGAYSLVETCKGVCNLSLVDATGAKVDLALPQVFGYTPPEDAQGDPQPSCRINGGEWASNTEAKLKLGCAKGTGQAPARETDVEFTMDVTLNLLERKVSIVQ